MNAYEFDAQARMLAAARPADRPRVTDTVARALVVYLDQLARMAAEARSLPKGHIYRRAIAAELWDVRRAQRLRRTTIATLTEAVVVGRMMRAPAWGRPS